MLGHQEFDFRHDAFGASHTELSSERRVFTKRTCVRATAGRHDIGDRQLLVIERRRRIDPHVRNHVVRGKREGVEVGDVGPAGVDDDLAVSAVDQAAHTAWIPVGRDHMQQFIQRLFAFIADGVIKGTVLQRLVGLRRYVRSADDDDGFGADCLDRLGQLQRTMEGDRRGRDPQDAIAARVQLRDHIVVRQFASFGVHGLHRVALLAKVGRQTEDSQRNLLSAEDPQFAAVAIHFADGGINQQHFRFGHRHRKTLS